MPAPELSFLMLLGIGMTLSGILITAISCWAIIRHVTRENNDTREIVRDVAQMQREVAFMIRRQYGDIDRDLQEIKELLGGQ
jgi:hypothetical protein